MDDKAKMFFDKAMITFKGNELLVARFFLSVVILALDYHYKEHGKNKENESVYPLVQKASLCLKNMME